MRPLALRLQALHLLQLLLEDASLAQLFEGSLAQAAAARGEPGPPTATAAAVVLAVPTSVIILPATPVHTVIR